MKEYHHDEEHNLELKVLSRHHGDPTLRQITEAVNIREKKPDLNNKEEWGNSNVPRIRRSINQHQGVIQHI